MKSIRIEVWITLIALAAGYLYIVEPMLPVSRAKYERSHAITRNRATFRSLDIAIRMMLMDGYQHPISFEQINDYQYLNYRPGEQICDAWNMPILLEIQDPNQYIFTSYGPNKQDDHGKGDDIVEKCDMNGIQPMTAANG